MISRRHFLQAAFGVSALGLGLSYGKWGGFSATQKLTQDDLLKFDDHGNVSLVHITDLHGQVSPVYYREPSQNIGVGAATGKPPHITGTEFLETFGIPKGSAQAYALSSSDFSSLAKTYGKMGGLDRIATVLKAIRAGRGDKTLFLDGGDTWQGSYLAMKTEGIAMTQLMSFLKPDGMTGHWEFTLGQERVKQLIGKLDYPFLAANIFDSEWEEPAKLFKPYAFYERGGVKVAVLGQAFPYTPIANPRYMMGNWSFGIREAYMQTQVDEVRAKGAQLVVLLSHNGFDVDRKMATQVKGLDVILCGHTHDALPQTVSVGQTLLVASGSNGKFLSRLDLDVQKGKVKSYRYKLIPIFSDAITPDLEMQGAVAGMRDPFADHLKEEIGTADQLLYRRGNRNGSWDDLICNALRQERDAEIAFSPGFRWGTSVLPESRITNEDLYNVTAISYPQTTRNELTGAQIKVILEDVADNLFNPDPYYQQGGDMVRAKGLTYQLKPLEIMGRRVQELRMEGSGALLEASKTYRVAGWASVQENVKGPPIWDVVRAYMKTGG